MTGAQLLVDELRKRQVGFVATLCGHGLKPFYSAARQSLNFVAIVAGDAAWGITLGEHLKEFGRGMASELGPIRFDQLAEACGCHGVRVSTPAEIESALRRALDEARPTVLHVPIVRSSPADGPLAPEQG